MDRDYSTAATLVDLALLSRAHVQGADTVPLHIGVVEASPFFYALTQSDPADGRVIIPVPIGPSGMQTTQGIVDGTCALPPGIANTSGEEREALDMRLTQVGMYSEAVSDAIIARAAGIHVEDSGEVERLNQLQFQGGELARMHGGLLKAVSDTLSTVDVIDAERRERAHSLLPESQRTPRLVILPYELWGTRCGREVYPVMDGFDTRPHDRDDLVKLLTAPSLARKPMEKYRIYDTAKSIADEIWREIPATDRKRLTTLFYSEGTRAFLDAVPEEVKRRYDEILALRQVSATPKTPSTFGMLNILDYLEISQMAPSGKVRLNVQYLAQTTDQILQGNALDWLPNHANEVYARLVHNYARAINKINGFITFPTLKELASFGMVPLDFFRLAVRGADYQEPSYSR